MMMNWLVVTLLVVICLVGFLVRWWTGLFAYFFNGLLLWFITSDLTTWWKMLLGWLPALVSHRVRRLMYKSQREETASRD